MNQKMKISHIAAPLCGVALISCGSADKTAQVAEKPNIVVLLCDDLGYGDLGCFGHAHIKTPNLDALAADGIKLTNFYSAAAVSSPSRAGLLTGRNPNRAGVYDFITGPAYSPDCRDLVHLRDGEVTIPMLLKSAGYTTCLSGKWHCSSMFNSDKQPTPGDLGFDHWFATHNNASPSHHNPNNFVRNGEEAGQLEGYSSELVVNEALTWLDKQPEGQPFYLQVTFHEPHENIASPEDLVQQYLPVSSCREQAEYFANVANMDRHAGRLLEYLRENHGDNTLVVFSSDNGPETLMRYSRAKHSYGTPGELSGMKLWTRDGGIRVCGIMKWLGRETFRGTTNAVVSSLDYLPMFCELAGVELPSRELDGVSCLEVFDRGEFVRNKPLMWVFYDALNQRVVAMRDGDWKIMAKLVDEDGVRLPNFHNLHAGNIDEVRAARLSDFRLYNIAADIDESDDLSQSNPTEFERMRNLMEAKYRNLLDGSQVWSHAE